MLRSVINCQQPIRLFAHRGSCPIKQWTCWTIRLFGMRFKHSEKIEPSRCEFNPYHNMPKEEEQGLIEHSKRIEALRKKMGLDYDTQLKLEKAAKCLDQDKSN